MRKLLGIVGSLSLLIGLGFYGTRAYSAPKQDPPPANASMTQEEFDRIIHAREKRIVGQLGLSAEQQARYDALSADLAARNQAFRARRPHRPEEGMEINAWWNGSLQQVFTPQQYTLYRQLWSSGPGSVATASSRAIVAAQSETRILATLGLSATQRKQMAEHSKLMQQRNVERQKLVSGDRETLLKHDAETVRVNQKVRSILTAKQYAKYCAAYGASTGQAYSPARRML